MDWLDEQGVKYEEIDATTVDDISVVPVTDINGQRIEGFDRPALKRALAALKESDAE